MEEVRMKMQLEHNKRLEEERKKIKEREQQKRLEKIQRYERFHKPGPFYFENKLGGGSSNHEAATSSRSELKYSADSIHNTRNNFQERHDRLLQQESLKLKQRANQKRAEKIAKFEKVYSFKNIPANNIQTPSSIKSVSAENTEKNYEKEIRLARLKMQEQHDMLVKQELLKKNSNEDNHQ